jgi:hypothetical protein
MHIDQLYPSRFLRCIDLDGKPLRVTIAGLKREDVGGEQKVVLSTLYAQLPGRACSCPRLLRLPAAIREGHGATSLAHVAKGVLLRHEKYPVS